MKNYSNSEKFQFSFEEENNIENDNYIEDLTKVEEENQYDLYNFFPDASF